MASDGSARKLAVILHADVVGSTDLVHRHEQLAHDRIQDTFRRLSESISRYGGIAHEIRGDALLAECDRASDAVSAALEFQAANTEHNNTLNDDIRPEVRIGISLGEVVIADGTLTGPDVVLAQRLEQLAEPGGVCISVEVQHALPGRLPFDYVDLGEQEVKGFDKPIRAYAVTLRSCEVIPAPEPRARVEKSAGTARRQLAVAGIVAAMLIAVGVAAWWQPWAPDVEPASVERMAFPLPEKPSVAVLPFDNMTGDPGQDFFVDAMTEGIITMLAKVPQLFVIARNSTFTYKGKPVEIRQVAEELGVRYVLEGSVQQSEDRIRVHAQLIDALTGHHVSAESFDSEVTDILTVQDEIAQKVVTGLEVTLTEGEQRRFRRADTNSPEAWDYLVRGRQHHLRFTKADSVQARQLFFKALELDPQYATALAMVAWTHILHAWRGWSENPEQEIQRATEYAEQALSIDDTNPDAITTMATLARENHQYDEAVALGERAVALSPSAADATALLASYYKNAGRHAEAVETIERAMRLAPSYPNWYLSIAGDAYRFHGKFDEAITAYEGWRDRVPQHKVTYALLASTHAEADDEESAQAAAKELLARDPEFSIEAFASRQNFKNPEDLERILDGLRKAGLPENPPLALPDKPSIAVLPFANLNNDPSQDFFSDGITNDIITELYRFTDLMVIASNSVFHYKGKPTKVQQVARELGVRYVLEGSVQRVDNKVRINVQFIDATTGGHLWAERYDRELDDVFAIQDEITQKVAATLGAYEGAVAQADLERARRKAAINLNAYEFVLLAREHRHRWNKKDNATALELLQKAADLDPQYARAHVGLGWTHGQDYWRRYVDTPEASLELAFASARRAVELDPAFAEAHWVLADIQLSKGDFERGVASFRRALELNPNHADMLADWGGNVLGDVLGDAEEGIKTVLRAKRLSPHANWYDTVLMWVYFKARRYEEAIATFGAIKYPVFTGKVVLTASYAHAGRMDEARAEAAKLLEERPKFTVSTTSVFTTEAAREHVREGLRKAGLPE